MNWWEWVLAILTPVVVVVHIILLGYAETVGQQRYRYYSINFFLCCALIATACFGVLHKLPPMLSSILITTLYGCARPIARAAYESALKR